MDRFLFAVKMASCTVQSLCVHYMSCTQEMAGPMAQQRTKLVQPVKPHPPVTDCKRVLSTVSSS